MLRSLTWGLVLLLCLALLLLDIIPARAATLTVTTNADPSVADSACSVREAIMSLNAGANSGDCVASGSYGMADTINFNIGGVGVRKITLASSLPAIVKPMTINGFSQSGSSANTNGPGLGSDAV